ncbi:MAG TPA: transposase [Pseudobdellovibrionaceae bacterium]|jgi:REP element-mobilizing transposase RayT
MALHSNRKKTARKGSQLSFFNKKIPRVFGGSLLKGNAKVQRPLSTKESIHLVLKSGQALGAYSMLQQRNAGKIDDIIRFHAKKCGVKIYHFVNVGNHLHLVIKLSDLKLFAKFIRTITGLIARHVLKKQRGPKQEDSPALGSKKTPSFWVARPFTRLIAWGKDYNFVAGYMKKNRNQAKRYFIPWGFDVVDPDLIQFLNTG